MRLLPSINAATRLTRAGKLTEALAALGGGLAPTLEPVPGSASAASAGSTLRAALDAGLGQAFGRLGMPTGLKAGEGAPPPGSEDTNFTEQSFVSPGGTLAYKLYVPRKAGPEPLPLVVMLHGCTQSPDDFAAGTRMNQHAEAEGFLVAYPAQSRAANAQKCWNWFRAVDQGRGGEPALIAGMVADILRRHAVDPSRVYVAGLSAGGAAAAVLGQNYPELFAAVGVHSGLACGAASDMASAFAAMRAGAVRTPTGAGIPTIVFHGDRDATVAPINAEQVSLQAALQGQSVTTVVESGRSRDGMDFTRTIQADDNGRSMAERWVLHGAGHAWSGGDAAGSYTEPRGPDASLEMLRFFRQHALATR